MSKEEMDKVVEMNKEDAENKTEEIKGTDFVEPKSKLRTAIKWVLGGLALLATGVIGGLIGHSIKDDDEEKTDDNSTETGSTETTEG